MSVNLQVKGLAHFRDDTLDNDCISYGNFLRDVSDFTGALDFTANILANHEHASGVSVNPQVKGLVHQLRDLIRRNLLAPTSPSPGAASPAECLPGAAGEPSSGGASPPSRGGASPETGGRSPPPPCRLQQEGGPLYAQQQNYSGPRRHRACCHGVNGRCYPLQWSTTQQQQQQQPTTHNNHMALAELF